MKTHEVFNQPSTLEPVNLFTSDACLQDAVQREGAGQPSEPLAAFGQLIGSADVFDLGRQANACTPVLHRFDASGRPRNEVEFHPAYHELMALSITQGIHASTWDHLVSGEAPAPGRHVARQAALYMMVQVEAGHMCPVTMTHASVPTLRVQPEIAERWLPAIVSRQYDPAFRPMEDKRGVTLGMGMTEKQGGTDVRANTTQAVADGSGGPGGDYRLTGHKWFFSAPMCDAFLVLAQAPGGLSCFLVPRFLPDGTPNTLLLQRLKDKVGNRSNASSEVEFDNTHAQLIGEEGRGVRHILEMATGTRLDCAVSSAGMMRQALLRAVHHCREREVFGKALIHQPLMKNVLADLALEVEGCTALAFRLARAFDRADDSEAEAGYRRLMTPVAKYWNCKRAPAFTYEAMECLGGNGYVNDSINARLYREAPVNAIWEGSGNVMCLDVLRAMHREPQALEAVMDELDAVEHRVPSYDMALSALRKLVTQDPPDEGAARRLVEMLALTASAAPLLDHAPAAIADTYCDSRLGSASGLYGALPHSAPFDSIIERAYSLTR